MGKFLIGVNYWASHAGTDMWRRWDESIVRKDFAELKQNGVKVLRVFPNWRDFQPVAETYSANHKFREYRMADDSYPANPFFLDAVMLGRFGAFCSIAQENDLQLIVGLITGWMSGRLFLPPALQNKNLYQDAEALYLQQLFVQGFVSAMKEQPCIIAWDLGNECNCMDEATTPSVARNWTAAIVNAIKARDSSRPVISGMHSLEPEGVWTMRDQGFLTDMLTTHPYPYWVEHCNLTPIDDFRTLLHATAQTEYYAGLGRKPCLVEEIGTMGPMICSDEISARFLQVNLWSNWAHGAAGLLWWCAFDQSSLTVPPYDWNMCERELGFLREDHAPKPVAEILRQFTADQERLALDLPPKTIDGVCVISREQDQWGVAYMSYLLAKQAGLTFRFAFCEDELPESKLYFLPSIRGGVMSKRSYEKLKEKVRAGSTLYISMDSGVLTEFEELTGFRVIRSALHKISAGIQIDETVWTYQSNYSLDLQNVTAQVLLRDSTGRIVFGSNSYGRGKVYLLNLPAEQMLLGRPDGLSGPLWKLYARIADENGIKHPVSKENPLVGLTIHEEPHNGYAVLINYSAEPQPTGLKCDGAFTAVYGHAEALPPFGAAVLRYARKDTQL